MRRGWKILIGLAVACVALALWPVISHYRAKRAVEAYRSQLRARGEKLTVTELLPTYSSQALKNGREFLNEAVRVVGRGPEELPMMEVLSPGHVLVTWEEKILPMARSTNFWPELGGVLDTNRSVMTAMQTTLEKAEPMNFDLDYTQSLNLFLPHLYPMRRATVFLWVASMYELHEGRPSNAWQDLRACVAVARLYRGEFLPVTQAQRAAINDIAMAATWQALRHPGWQESQLASLQQDWEEIDLMDTLEPSLAMERATDPEVFAMVRRSFSNFTQWTGKNSSGVEGVVGETLMDPRKGLQSLMNSYPRYWVWKGWWSYQEELLSLQFGQTGLEAVRKLRANDPFISTLKRFDEETAALSIRVSDPEGRFVMNRYTLDGSRIHDFLSRMTGAEARRRMVVVAIALERYRLRQGNYPAELDELTPEYLRRTPLDPMDGKPLRYHRKANGSFELYSVGEDGQDNGGDATSTEPAGSSYKRWWRARDVVWPEPATAAEVKAYEEKTIAIFNSWQSRFVADTNSTAGSGDSSSLPAGSNSVTRTN